MAKFRVIYRDNSSAQPKQATQDSISESYLRMELSSKGWQVLLVQPLVDTGWASKIKTLLTGKLKLSFRTSVSTSELCMFCEVVKALYAAGVQMLQIIQMTIDETSNEWFRKRLVIVLERLRMGDDLSTAMSDPRCVKAFPRLMSETVKIGEANGRLDESLARLVVTFKRAVETRRETISAMLIPAFTLLFFFGVSVVIARTIPPLLLDIVGEKELASVYSRLPGAIRLLFFLYDHPFYLMFPPLVILGFVFLWKWGMKYHATRVALTKFQRKVWLIGPIFYQFALVRFLDRLAANHETGIQVSESLKLIEGTVNDALIEDSLRRIHQRVVQRGMSLSAAVSAPSEESVYPGLVRQMIRAGEESGKLSEMVRPITEFYEEQAKALLKRALGMMPIVVTILLGGMIGPVVIGIYKTLILLSESAAK